MDIGITGRTALVTGASGCIGRSIACALAAEGARVAVVARRPERIAATVRAITDVGGEAEAFVCDVSDPRRVDRLRAEATARLGAPSIVVHGAAAFAGFARVEDVDPAEFDRTILDNARMLHLVVRAFLPQMKADAWGRVIAVGSLAAVIGGRGQSAYAAAKASLTGYMRTLAAEIGKYDVTANVVVPGAIDTERLRHAVDEEVRRRLAESTPVGRLGDPEEIAAAVTFLASRQASFINGSSLNVTGGYELSSLC